MGEISREKLIDILINKQEPLNFSGVDFSDENLEGLDFSNSTLINTKFHKSNLWNLVLRNSILENISFEKSIGKPILENTKIKNCMFSHSEYGTLSFKTSTIQNIRLSNLENIDNPRNETQFEFQDCDITDLSIQSSSERIVVEINKSKINKNLIGYQVGELQINDSELFNANIYNFSCFGRPQYNSGCIRIFNCNIIESKLKRLDGIIKLENNIFSKSVFGYNNSKIDSLRIRFCTFEFSEITSCIIKESNIFQTNIKNSTIQRSQLEKTQILNSETFDSLYSELTFSESSFENFHFYKSKLQNIKFFNVKIDRSNVKDTTFSNVKFIDSELVSCNFTNVYFEECDFSGITNSHSTIFIKCKFGACTGMENIETGIEKNDFLSWFKI